MKMQEKIISRLETKMILIQQVISLNLKINFLTIMSKESKNLLVQKIKEVTISSLVMIIKINTKPITKMNSKIKSLKTIELNLMI